MSEQSSKHNFGPYIVDSVETRSRVISIHEFLNNSECNELVNLINQKSCISYVASSNPKVNHNDLEYRNSQTCRFDASLQIIDSIKDRISLVLGLTSNLCEPITGQKYTKGQFFRLHYDWFGEDWSDSYKSKSGDRTHTFMVYLNQSFCGGMTNFPLLDECFRPETGKAIYWQNLDDNCAGNTKMLHESTAVFSGEKYVMTTWWRQKPICSMDGIF
ncbi:2OG-Fe(II) oxygenase [Synechococcus sp. AH-603-M21]|nr:2OG-Fe(II) oxygenase [Synechococcus sp. AH-603-M21]